jgi:hypothetical protein
MARKRKLEPPPGSRITSAGRITLSIPVVVDGHKKRHSQHRINPAEPKSYGTPEEAWDGYRRTLAFLDGQTTQAQTVRAFWADWTDPNHYLWGKLSTRSEQSIRAYETRTRRFVEMFGERPLDSITEEDVHAYLKAGGVHSSLRAIGTLFHDAATRGLVTAHPCATLAQQAETIARARRKREDGVVPAESQIEEMLERAQEPCFPPDFYGWLLTGVRTGMRGGEIDGMEWEHLKGNRYSIRWQFNNELHRPTPPKHDSIRDLLLPPDLMDEIEKRRGNGTRWIWNNRNLTHWSHDSRARWWEWCKDGGLALRQIVGGATIYRATRHYWASWAVNVAGIQPYQAALLYGHSDGGKLLTETYARPDHERAMRAALDAAERLSKISDLSAERARRRA